MRTNLLLKKGRQPYKGLFFIGSCCAFSMITNLISTGKASAQEFTMTRPEKPRDGNTTITGGSPEDPVKWPATFIFRVKNKGETTGCTSTAVGKRVILTAAHCVNNKSEGDIDLGNNTGSIGVSCDHHPGYLADGESDQSENKTKDFALCLLEKPLEGFPFERVAWSREQGKVGANMHLLGYGCTDQGFNPRKPVLYGFSIATIQRQPVSGDNNLWTETRAPGALCAGDSGGAAYVQDKRGQRQILGVNSWLFPENLSEVATTNTSSFHDWAKDWLENNNKNNADGEIIAICGLSDSATGCRNN